MLNSVAQGIFLFIIIIKCNLSNAIVYLKEQDNILKS